MSTIIEADLTYVDGRFQRGLQVEIDGDRIARVGPLGATPTQRLVGRALLPGFVNAHSHAFQRGLRGLGESYPEGMGDFWTWREAMYSLVLSLDRESMFRLCKQAFDEMLAAGFTTVGEFHYLHHSNIAADSPADAPGDFAFDDVVLEAAAASGIRIVLLQSFYKTGGFGQPLVGGQRRFSTPSVEAFLRNVDGLAARTRGATQSIGVAPHSLRAVPLDDLSALVAAAEQRKLVCHIHVEEQRKEIVDCAAAIRRTPLEWLLANVRLSPRFTMIHATHSTLETLRRYVDTGANVCICPITEGNLGDGLADVATMLHRPDAVCIGTDSNVRIDAIEELRWLEFVRRLRHERRGICKNASGEVAAQLLRCGAENGGRALGQKIGRIESGYLADLIAIDIGDPSLAGATDASLAPALVLGSSGAVVREVAVGGRWVR
ncbi:MAG: formimidoylglutamate deiminase [Planctomycetota bacterium]